MHKHYKGAKIFMATAKKATTKTKPVAKKTTKTVSASTKKAPAKKVTKVVASSTPVRTKTVNSSKKAVEMENFKLAPEDQKFMSFKPTKQTAYWLFLTAYITVLMLYILSLQVQILSVIQAS